jgi:hypothetical protein
MKKMEPLTHKSSSDDPNWNESYYFVFYDKEQRIGGMSRVGFKPNKPEGMTFLFLFLPDGSVATFHATDECLGYPEFLRVEGMVHECKEDGKWRYRFEGQLIIVENPETLPEARQKPELIADIVEGALDLEFNAINDTYEYSEHMAPESLERGKKTGDEHWEQIAIINGKVRIGERTYEIRDAMGQRDHTHGIRDWTGVRNWFYFVVWFNQQLAINPAAVVGEDGGLGTGGFLFRNGENIPLTSIRILTHEIRSDDRFPIQTEMELVDANGEKHILKAAPGPIIPVPFTDENGRTSILIQSFGSFELNGFKGGFGSYETLSREK